jgi:hypothetical protein
MITEIAKRQRAKQSVRIATLLATESPQITITDPFIVLGFLEQSLESLKNPLARMEAACHCIQMRKEMMLNQFGKSVTGIEEVAKGNNKVITDPLLVLDQLEFAVLSLTRPRARLRAWLMCSIIRTDIMYREYGMDNDKY